MYSPWIDTGVVLLVVLTGGISLLAALMLWRHGYVRGWRNARSTPPACPQCGYNLSGLTYCRCPECGTEFRIDKLWQTPLFNQKKPDRTSDRHEKSNVA